MACARKVYSYGVRKKEGGEPAPWDGMLKEDEEKESKLPSKKSVWSKASSKTLIRPMTKKLDESYDPFELPDDVSDDDDDDDVNLSDLVAKLPKTLHGSSKHSNLKMSKTGDKYLPQHSGITPEKSKLVINPRKVDEISSAPKDEKQTVKTLVVSAKSPTVIKSKILGKPLPQNSVTINSKELKLFGSPRKSDEGLSPQKEGKTMKLFGSPRKTDEGLSPQKEGKTIPKALLTMMSKKSTVIKSKVGSKPPPKKSANINAKESKLCGTPKKSNVNNGPSRGVHKCSKLSQNSIVGKKQITKKKKIANEAKSKVIRSVKKRPRTSKINNTGKVQITKTMLDINKLSPSVRIKRAQIDSNAVLGGGKFHSELLRNRNSVVKTKLGGKTQQKGGNTLSVQFIDDNTVLAIKHQDVKHVLKDDAVFSHITNDVSRNHVTFEEDKLENDSLCTYEEKVKSKRSLFSYYDKQTNQSNSISNANLKEFDFLSADDGGVDATEEASYDDVSTFPVKRSHCPDPLDVVASTAKKNRQEDILEGISSEPEGKDVLDQEVSQKVQAKSSPFKSLKCSAGLRPRKNFRRFSSLPTNISLDNSEIEEDDNKPELSSPPPLYRSNIFGFGSGGAPVRVRRDEKELYTVVRNTKHAHECLEYGESQQFKDDLEYLLDGLKSKHNVSTRCLSALELASKCLSPEFRMHIKAHGIIENIFTVLEDAFSEEQLLLCASMIMYVLAKDKLKINFNKKTIGFMLQVITKKRPDFSKNQAYERMMKKIRGIFEKLEDVDVDLETVDAKVLARQALLSLTVKRTGEWFKDEIRVLGGLDDVAEQVYYCCKCVQKRTRIDQNCTQMKRCLALFIDMTYKSTINQAYLVSCRNSVVIECCIRTLHTITTSLDLEKEVTLAVAECIMSIQLLLMNLSHENTNACLKICKQENGLAAILRSTLHLSKYLPSHLAYENTIVSLCLLVNLVANNPQNRTIMNKTVTTKYCGLERSTEVSSGAPIPPVEALMQMFLLHSEACREADLMQELEKLEQEENEQNAGRHYQDDEYGLTCGDKFEDTLEDEKGALQEDNPPPKPQANDGPLNEIEKRDIQSTLDKAQRHMEDSHLAAYTALLIGLLMEDESVNQEIIHSLLPDGNFMLLLESIEKILSFMQMTSPLSKNDHQCMERIMEVIKKCNGHFSEKG